MLRPLKLDYPPTVLVYVDVASCPEKEKGV